MKKKNTKGKSYLDKFNDLETKGNVKNSAIKSFADIIAGALIGPGISAVSGKLSPLAGAALIATGHYIGDKSGVLRAAGTSTLAHGIAKAKEYQESPEMDTPQNRLKGLGNDLLTALHIKWKQEQQQANTSESSSQRSVTVELDDKKTDDTVSSNTDNNSGESESNDKNNPSLSAIDEANEILNNLWDSEKESDDTTEEDSDESSTSDTNNYETEQDDDEFDEDQIDLSLI